jgi:POT family proton-dependent oligopeptide transporter
MSSLLVLYMVNQLLLPGHAEHIAGFASFRSSVEAIVGPLSTQALASQVYGLYAGFVYFTPLLGGLVADRWIGQRNAVIIGALSMTCGHIAMAFDRSFLLALTLLVVGSGFLKGNISAQVGALYPRDDESRRTRGFSIFSMSINFGAMAGPLLCGWLAQRYGWDRGFGVAAIFMMAGLATYLVGYRHLPARVEREASESSALTASDWRVIRTLLFVLLISIFQSLAYFQCSNVFPVFAQQHVAPTVAGLQIPIPWYQSLDPMFSIIGVPVLFALWRYQATRQREPGDLGKIGVGAAIVCVGNLILAAATLAAGDTPVSPIWPLLYFACMGIGFLFYWPTLLALVSRTAPAQVNATMMGVAFMSLFVANNLIGWIGGFYERMGPVAFWTMHAGISITGTLLVLVFGRSITRALKARA